MSLTGEYCVREGVYAAEAPSPEELAAAQGTPCNKISSISCIRLVATASLFSLFMRLHVSESAVLTSF